MVSESVVADGSVMVKCLLMNQSQVDLVHLEMIKRRRQNSDFPADAADTDARVELIWSFGELNEIKGFDEIFHKLDPFLPPHKVVFEICAFSI